MQLADAQEDFAHGETTHGVFNLLGIVADPIDVAVAIGDTAVAAAYGVLAIDAAHEQHERRMIADPEYKLKHDAWQLGIDRSTESLNRQSTVGNKF
jgi:hypothetical protein